ncbi:MAG: bacteriocin-protection protein [Planctomycetales bacterium 71-10]|nr:MAG: bacteriocin-protection protein [Planctomycetales bacterium 71-10]
MDPVFFESPEGFRAWLCENHATAAFLLVGFHKKGAGRKSMTWPESVDEALCFGWIDGVRKGIDAERYSIRFTPRKKGSVWSAVNIARVRALTELGRMQPTGLVAFEARREDRSGICSHEQGHVDLPEVYLGLLRENPAAWEFYEKQPASYRKAVNWWVVGAKKEETRRRRLDSLIAHSALGDRVPQFTWKKASG